MRSSAPPSMMQSTGQTSTHDLSLRSTQVSVMMYAIWLRKIHSSTGHLRHRQLHLDRWTFEGRRSATGPSRIGEAASSVDGKRRLVATVTSSWPSQDRRQRAGYSDRLAGFPGAPGSS